MFAALSTMIHPGLFDAIFQTIIHSLWQIPVIALCLKLYSQRPSLTSSFGNYHSNLFAIITSIIVAGFTFLYFLMRMDQPAALTGTSNVIDIHFTNALGTIIPSSQTPGPLSLTDFLNQYKHYVVLFWAIGFIFLLGRITAGWIGLHFIKRSLSFKVSDQLNASFIKIKNALGLSGSIRIAHSAIISIPMVIGHVRPIILLPLATLNRLSTEEVEAILVHEMAHILHYDFIKNLIVMMGEALFFYHPVIWLLSSEIREEREHCCDDTVMKHFPNRIGYAKMLVKLEEIHIGQSTGLSMALFNSKFKLMKRVKRILNSSSEPRLKRTNIAIAALLVCSVILFSSAGIINDSNKKEVVSSLDNIERSAIVISEDLLPDLAKEVEDVFSRLSTIPDRITPSRDLTIPTMDLIPDPVHLILPGKDTIDKEEKEKLKKKLKEKRKELRDKTREIRDKMRAQSEKIRKEHREELKLKRKELKEIRKKLGEEGHSYNFGEDENFDVDFNFDFDSENLEEWSANMGEWGAELGEKISAQFDEEWVSEMAEMGAELGANIGNNFGEIFDEEWAAKWEKFGTEFKFNMEQTFDDEWAGNMAKIGEDIAASFDDEWLEDMSEMGEEISRAVNEAMSEFQDEGYKYSYTFGDVTDGRQLKSNLVSQLNKDGLLTDGENKIVISDDEMKVNDVVQSAARLSTYQEIVKRYSDDAFRNGETEVTFSIEGTSLDGSGHNVLVVDVEK